LHVGVGTAVAAGEFVGTSEAAPVGGWLEGVDEVQEDINRASPKSTVRTPADCVNKGAHR
jgi:hypothetical protein